MTPGFEIMNAQTIAPIFGVSGLAAQIVWPLFRRRVVMLLIQMGSASAYATSYALLDRNTAAAVCLAGAVQTLAVLCAGEQPWLRKSGYAFLPGVMVIGLLTYSGFPSLLAVTACCLSMLGRMQNDTLRMRGVQLSASPFGAAHDIAVGAWPALAGALMSFVIAARVFGHEYRQRRPFPKHEASRSDRAMSDLTPSQSEKEN